MPRFRNPLYRYELCPPKFFSKTFKFSIIFYSTLQISGGGQFRKACRSRKKESKLLEITCKQSEQTVGTWTISKIEKRREFVWGLCHVQCPKNSFKRLYTVKGLLVLVEKASFSEEFRCKFQSGGEGNNPSFELQSQVNFKFIKMRNSNTPKLFNIAIVRTRCRYIPSIVLQFRVNFISRQKKAKYQ